MGPAQAPTEFATTSVFWDFMLGILSLFMDISLSRVLPDTLIDSQARVGFVGAQQGSLSVFEYEIGFLERANQTFSLSEDRLCHSIWHWSI